MFWLGTRDGMESTLVPQHGVDFEAIAFRGVRGKGLRTLLLGPFALAGGLLSTACAIIRRRAPDVVLGFGGFASFPGALMGVARGRPLVLHDANAVAGLANRVLAYGADRILLGFPGCARAAAMRARSSGSAIRCATTIVALPPPRAALRRTHGPAAAARRRRQPRRAGAERAACRRRSR